MNKNKHQDVKFVSESDALKLVNDPRFMALEEYGECYEVYCLTCFKYDL